MKAQSSNHNVSFTLSEKRLFKLAEQALFFPFSAEQSLVEGVGYPRFTPFSRLPSFARKT